MEMGMEMERGMEMGVGMESETEMAIEMVMEDGDGEGDGDGDGAGDGEGDGDRERPPLPACGWPKPTSPIAPSSTTHQAGYPGGVWVALTHGAAWRRGAHPQTPPLPKQRRELTHLPSSTTASLPWEWRSRTGSLLKRLLSSSPQNGLGGKGLPWRCQAAVPEDGSPGPPPAALQFVRLHSLVRLCPFQGVWCARLACVDISRLG